MHKVQRRAVSHLTRMFSEDMTKKHIDGRCFISNILIYQDLWSIKISALNYPKTISKEQINIAMQQVKIQACAATFKIKSWGPVKVKFRGFILWSPRCEKLQTRTHTQTQILLYTFVELRHTSCWVVGHKRPIWSKFHPDTLWV